MKEINFVAAKAFLELVDQGARLQAFKIKGSDEPEGVMKLNGKGFYWSCNPMTPKWDLDCFEFAVDNELLPYPISGPTYTSIVEQLQEFTNKPAKPKMPMSHYLTERFKVLQELAEEIGEDSLFARDSYEYKMLKAIQDHYDEDDPFQVVDAAHRIARIANEDARLYCFRDRKRAEKPLPDYITNTETEEYINKNNPPQRAKPKSVHPELNNLYSMLNQGELGNEDVWEDNMEYIGEQEYRGVSLHFFKKKETTGSNLMLSLEDNELTTLHIKNMAPY